MYNAISVYKLYTGKWTMKPITVYQFVSLLSLYRAFTYNKIYFHPSSIYSCSKGHIWEHEFCHLDCWAVMEKFLERRKFCLSVLLFGVVFSISCGQNFFFNFSKNILASALKSYIIYS